MANKKITDLTALTSADSTDVLPIVDVSANTTKKVTVDGLIATGSISTAKLADDAVTAAKTNFAGDYSTSEVSTGFTWTDGKTIYKKTVSIGALPNTTTKSTAHGITNLSYVILVQGMASTSTNFFPLPYLSTSSLTFGIGVSVQGSNIVTETGADRSGYTGYVTLFYTKTV